MKTRIAGINQLPVASDINVTSKSSSFISYFLPEECRVRTRADFYYVAALAFLCVTFIFVPFIIGTIACVVKAKKYQKGGQS